ncbi:DUF2399 domain-containing protein [Levilactobacillus yonginensis]|uniref:DUF2399 domain-containing protein n=1 Tax=Levilactobacillus yonginensis TaxID=1054041 RepID=UPI00345D1492
MSEYSRRYEAETGKTAPIEAQQLDKLFEQIARGIFLPPRGQQAVDLGFTAHSLSDPYENPVVYQYYQWVLRNVFEKHSVNEMTAKLIGMAFTCANVFETSLPQPLTLNPWQIEEMKSFPLKTKRAVVVENNGVFVWLVHLHPDWSLINQAGNDFNEAYIKLLQRLEQRGLQVTYLGDLDSRGIQMADHLYRQLNETSIAEFTAIQTPENVSKWLTLKGKIAAKRTHRLAVTTPRFQQEMNSISLMGKFVEQEQLITDYENLIPGWL